MDPWASPAASTQDARGLPPAYTQAWAPGSEESGVERAAFMGLLGGEYYRTQLIDIMADRDDRKHFGLDIRLEDLLNSCPHLGSQLSTDPVTALVCMENWFHAAQSSFICGPFEIEGRDSLCLKQFVHARVCQLYNIEAYVRPNISSIRSSDQGRFLQVNGTVTRTSQVRMVERNRSFQCSRCKYMFSCTIEIEHDNTLEMPRSCPNPEPVKGKQRCVNTQFVPADEGTPIKTDYQEIKIQEAVHSLAVGSVPRSVTLVLEDDLVDVVKAGDDVIVSGVVLHRWGRVCKGQRCQLEMVIRVNHIKTSASRMGSAALGDVLLNDFDDFWSYYAQRPLQGRNAILQSFCPQLHGLYLIKLAFALILTGGVGKQHDNGTHQRGESHLLLIGDPGTGKSQFLRFAAKITPRAVLTTGIGTTSAGLTCSVSKDSGEWMLEAGALVMADKGVCCIDEFSSIREADRTSIHEAMEQQTISVAKAGLVCKLNSRCTIIAATNPKGKYDANLDVTTNTAIASPLLSRFDLVLVLLDTVNPAWDTTVSSFILSDACMRGAGLLAQAPDRSAALNAIAAAANGSSTPRRSHPPVPPAKLAQSFVRSSIEVGVDMTSSGGGARLADGRRVEDAGSGVAVWWSLERLQAYLAHVKAVFQPGLSASSQTVLKRYYELQRSSDTRSAARTTVRLLDSLVRLAQAHARIMRRHLVLIQDAVIAVMLVETSIHASSILASAVHGTQSPLHATFPIDPDAAFVAEQQLVLLRLGLKGLADSSDDCAAASGSKLVPESCDAVGRAAEESAYSYIRESVVEAAATTVQLQSSQPFPVWHTSSENNNPPTPRRPLTQDRNRPAVHAPPLDVNLDDFDEFLASSFPQAALMPPPPPRPPRTEHDRQGAVARVQPKAANHAQTQDNDFGPNVQYRASGLASQQHSGQNLSGSSSESAAQQNRTQAVMGSIGAHPPVVHVYAVRDCSTVPPAASNIGVRGTDWFHNPGHHATPEGFINPVGAAARFMVNSVPFAHARGMIYEMSADAATAASQATGERVAGGSAPVLQNQQPDYLLSSEGNVPVLTPLHSSREGVVPVGAEELRPQNHAGVKRTAFTAFFPEKHQAHQSVDFNLNTGLVACFANKPVAITALPAPASSLISAASTATTPQIDARERSAQSSASAGIKCFPTFAVMPQSQLFISSVFPLVGAPGAANGMYVSDAAAELDLD